MARMVTIRTALVLTACLALAGCGTTYVAQAAKGQLQILTARKPITQVLADPAADPALKKRLEVVQRGARDFASRELGLPNNKSYTSYADLKREFVVWSVVATPEFSVEPREWCFPIVGCVAYRGYFRKESAEAFAETLRSEGLDTIVGGVPAYSTLGKFNDPILNTMMIYGDDELASIMFHELSHQLVYIQDDTSFNEAFAVTVEQEGLARWLKFRGREADLAKYQKRRARQAEGVELVARFRGELSALYGMNFEPEVMRARKAQVFRATGGRAARAGCAVRHGVRALPRSSTASRTTRAWLRSPPTTTACRGSSGCWPGNNTICRASTPRRARWPNYRVRNGAAVCADRNRAHA